MNFVKFIKFKYKLNSQVLKKRTKADVYAERSIFAIFILLLTIIIYFILKALSKKTLDNMKIYIICYYSIITIISFSISIKKYYKEYFQSLDREILLTTPVKKQQIILARFFIISIEVITVNSIFYLPFILACFFSNVLSFQILVITLIQIICMSFFASAFSHILFSVAFLLCRGKSLKTVAYSLVIGISTLITALIVFSKNFKNLVLTNNILIKFLFYTIFQYPSFILSNSLTIINTIKFIFIITVYTILFSILTFYLTYYCYKKGLLSISSRELQKSFYMNKLSNLTNKIIKDSFIKKDVTYLIRTPKILSNYIPPILLTCLLEFKQSFFYSGFIQIIFISIFAITITSITLNILQFDDVQHKDLMIIVPLNTKKLFKSRSILTFVISLFISSLLITIICILRSVIWKNFIFSLIYILIIVYTSSKIMTSRIIKKSTKNNYGYKYNGSLTSTIFYYSFIGGLPLTLIFCIIFNYLKFF